MNNDLPDILVEKLEGAKRYERYILSICPFHDDTRPSFFVYPDTYRCASCGRWGKTEDLVKKLDTLHVYHAPEQSYQGNNPFSKWTKEHKLSEILKVAEQNLPVKYLKDRGITHEVQSNLRIGQLDGWITFPIYNQSHKLIGAVARAGEGNPSKSKYILPYKQDPNMLYVPSWDRCMKKDTIYVTFGILDAVTLYAAGLAAMSTTTGKRITATAFDIIRKHIIFIPDEGETPEALKIAAKLGWRGKVKQLKYPDGCKDVNDLVWKAHMSLDELRGML